MICKLKKPTYHSEVSVANLGINSANTKYIFFVKKIDFKNLSVDFFYKCINSFF